MLNCGCILLFGHLTMTLLQCGTDGFRLAKESPQYADLASGEKIRLDEGLNASSLTDKLMLLDQLACRENDVIETKTKRSFPGESNPLDRLSITNMEVKGKQRYLLGVDRKVVELPRRRVNIPIDRIGIGRLPSNRG